MLVNRYLICFSCDIYRNETYVFQKLILQAVAFNLVELARPRGDVETFPVGSRCKFYRPGPQLPRKNRNLNN